MNSTVATAALRISCRVLFRRSSSISTVSVNGLESSGPVKAYEDIPKIPSFPLVGVLWAYMPIIGKYKLSELNLTYAKKYQEYGPILREDFSKDIRFVYLYDNRDFETYLRQEGRHADRLHFDTIRLHREARPKDFLGGGLTATSGAEWYNLRSKVQPHMLKPKAIHAYLPGVDGISREFVAQIPEMQDQKREIQDFRVELAKWGLESIGLIGLDARLGALERNPALNQEATSMISAANELFELFQKLEFGFSFLWRFISTPTYRRLMNRMDFFADLSLKHISAAVKRLEAIKDTDHKQITLLETFLTQEEMDPRLANTMIMDMLLAGVDTTTTTTNFVLYHLARNPEVQEKAYKEVTSVLPNKEAPITSATLNDIRYIKSCVKETMRLTPIVSGFPRTLREEMVFSGYRVPAGTMVMFTTIVACSLEENFANPTTFLPERWLDKKDHSPFAFMPFGFGVRSCIGRRIAEMEIHTLLIRIIQKYKIEYHYEDLECMTKLINIPKYPLKFRFIER